MQGVCCDCQETHHIRPSRKGQLDLEEADFDGDQMNYVMDAHEPSFGGGPCTGEGTTPQALVKE